MRRIVLAALLAAAACDDSIEAQARGVCAVACRCFEAPLPAVQDMCITECTDALSNIGLPEACVSCFEANADRCAALDFVCDAPCSISMPVEDRR